MSDIKPIRRIVVRDYDNGTKSGALSDGPSPDVRTDPARPGYASQRLWVTDGTPAKIVLETLQLPHALGDAGDDESGGGADHRIWRCACHDSGHGAGTGDRAFGAYGHRAAVQRDGCEARGASRV